jgi:hypothetical protein
VLLAREEEEVVVVEEGAGPSMNFVTDFCCGASGDSCWKSVLDLMEL